MKIASPRYQVDFVSKMRQLLNFEVPKHHIWLFTRAHNQFADALTTLASMVKLSKGDDMR